MAVGVTTVASILVVGEVVVGPVIFSRGSISGSNDSSARAGEQ